MPYKYTECGGNCNDTIGGIRKIDEKENELALFQFSILLLFYANEYAKVSGYKSIFSWVAINNKYEIIKSREFEF